MNSAVEFGQHKTQFTEDVRVALEAVQKAFESAIQMAVRNGEFATTSSLTIIAKGTVNWLNQISAEVIERLWQSSLVGGALVLLAMLVSRNSKLPSFINCWVLRLAVLKLIVLLLWLHPIELPVLSQSQSRFVNSDGHPLSDSAREYQSKMLPSERIEVLETALAPTSMPQTVEFPRPTLLTCLLLFWSAGVLVQIAKMRRHWLQTEHIRATSIPVLQQPTNEYLLEISRQLQVRCPELRIHDNLSSPCLIGTIRPIILLPREFNNRTGSVNAVTKSTLAHELAHVRRNDLAWSWLRSVANSLFYFHPILWYLRCEWHVQAEIAADETAREVTGCTASEYASGLLSFLNDGSQRQFFSIGYSSAYVQLERRVLAMRNSERIRGPQKTFLIIVLAFFSVFGIAPWKLTTADATPQAIANESQVGNKWQVQVQVQNADGRPIANPTVGIQNGANVDVTWQSGDASGKAIVDVDTRSPRYVYLLARAAGFAPMRAFWGSRDGKPADDLPSEFTFRMEEATSVGGTVLDEQGKVRLSAAVRRSADASRAQVSFFQEVYTTDKEGHWTCDKRPQIIMGTVVDRTTKLPISEFVIERAFEGMTGYPDGLSWGDPTRSANGKYRKTVTMPPLNGSYTYRAIAAGYEVSTSKSIPFREGDTTIVNFELTPK